MSKELFAKAEVENEMVTARFFCPQCDFECSRLCDRCVAEKYKIRKLGIYCPNCGHAMMLFAINEDPF